MQNTVWILKFDVSLSPLMHTRFSYVFTEQPAINYWILSKVLLCCSLPRTASLSLPCVVIKIVLLINGNFCELWITMHFSKDCLHSTVASALINVFEIYDCLWVSECKQNCIDNISFGNSHDRPTSKILLLVNFKNKNSLLSKIDNSDILMFQCYVK